MSGFLNAVNALSDTHAPQGRFSQFRNSNYNADVTGANHIFACDTHKAFQYQAASGKFHIAFNKLIQDELKNLKKQTVGELNAEEYQNLIKKIQKDAELAKLATLAQTTYRAYAAEFNAADEEPPLEVPHFAGLIQSGELTNMSSEQASKAQKHLERLAVRAEQIKPFLDTLERFKWESSYNAAHIECAKDENGRYTTMMHGATQSQQMTAIEQTLQAMGLVEQHNLLNNEHMEGTYVVVRDPSGVVSYHIKYRLDVDGEARAQACAAMNKELHHRIKNQLIANNRQLGEGRVSDNIDDPLQAVQVEVFNQKDIQQLVALANQANLSDVERHSPTEIVNMRLRELCNNNQFITEQNRDGNIVAVKSIHYKEMTEQERAQQKAYFAEQMNAILLQETNRFYEQGLPAGAPAAAAALPVGHHTEQSLIATERFALLKLADEQALVKQRIKVMQDVARENGYDLVTEKDDAGVLSVRVYGQVDHVAADGLEDLSRLYNQACVDRMREADAVKAFTVADNDVIARLQAVAAGADRHPALTDAEARNIVRRAARHTGLDVIENTTLDAEDNPVVAIKVVKRESDDPAVNAQRQREFNGLVDYLAREQYLAHLMSEGHYEFFISDDVDAGVLSRVPNSKNSQLRRELLIEEVMNAAKKADAEISVNDAKKILRYVAQDTGRDIARAVPGASRFISDMNFLKEIEKATNEYIAGNLDLNIQEEAPIRIFKKSNCTQAEVEELRKIALEIGCNLQTIQQADGTYEVIATVNNPAAYDEAHRNYLELLKIRTSQGNNFTIANHELVTELKEKYGINEQQALLIIQRTAQAHNYNLEQGLDSEVGGYNHQFSIETNLVTELDPREADMRAIQALKAITISGITTGDPAQNADVKHAFTVAAHNTAQRLNPSPQPGVYASQQNRMQHAARYEVEKEQQDAGVSIFNPIPAGPAAAA